MSYRERQNQDPQQGLGCVGESKFERFTGLGSEVTDDVGFLEHAREVVRNAPWRWRIAGAAAAAVALYGAAAMVYPPARQPLIPVVEMLTGEDINNSAPASYPELLQQSGDISAPTEFRAEPATAGDSVIYSDVAAGETSYLYP